LGEKIFDEKNLTVMEILPELNKSRLSNILQEDWHAAAGG
jgi:hypothetical protein